MKDAFRGLTVGDALAHYDHDAAARERARQKARRSGAVDPDMAAAEEAAIEAAEQKGGRVDVASVTREVHVTRRCAS